MFILCINPPHIFSSYISLSSSPHSPPSLPLLFEHQAILHYFSNKQQTHNLNRNAPRRQTFIQVYISCECCATNSVPRIFKRKQKRLEFLPETRTPQEQGPQPRNLVATCPDNCSCTGRVRGEMLGQTKQKLGCVARKQADKEGVGWLCIMLSTKIVK